jgi:molybdenum cofactor synthesis domain-containing protein
MELKAGVLAIGNEVVEGQITNRNAAWLSEQLSEMGIQPIFHLSCRDVQKEIEDCLNFLSPQCHLILVSGGLGPTRDDCTRQTLSQWLGSELELDQKAWDEIQNKLSSRNLTIREGHKNQAYIPKGSTLLANSVGVAPGFFLKAQKSFLASLPGPPGELTKMFIDELRPQIEKAMAPKKEKTLYTWGCLGAPESEIAHIADSILGSDLEVGYRLHRPYVEVKLWLSLKEKELLQSKLDLFQEKITPWFVGPRISDVHKNFHKYLSKFEYVFIIDQLTTGLLLEKLKEHKQATNLRYQCFEHSNYRYFSKTEVEQIIKALNSGQTDKQLFFGLFPAGDHAAWASFNDEIHKIEIPHRFKIKSRYGEHYAIERSFLLKQNG